MSGSPRTLRTHSDSTHRGDDARTDRAATLTQREAHTRLDTHRALEREAHHRAITRHHLRAAHLEGAGHVGRAEVELRHVARAEGRVTTALLLAQREQL